MLEYFQTSAWLTLPSFRDTKADLESGYSQSKDSFFSSFFNTTTSTSTSSDIDITQEMDVEAQNYTFNSDSTSFDGDALNDVSIDFSEPLGIVIEDPYPEQVAQDVVSASNVSFPPAIFQQNNNLNLDLQAFLQRLKEAKYYNIDSELAQLITRDDLTKIYDAILNNANFINDLHNLQGNQAFYLDKQYTGLPRTINILRSKNNEYKLILETKSKLADGSKQLLQADSGTVKKGKPAWRVDTYPQTPYFNLVVVLENEQKLETIKSEVACSQYFASDYVNENELGQVHQKKGKCKVSVYSPKAICDLSKIIDKNIPFNDKKQIMSDIMHGVKQFHDAGFVIQDLKPKNILIFSKEGRCRAKITDFGLVATENSSEALATNGYHSPEIAYVQADSSSPHHSYFNDPTYGPYYADLISKPKSPYDGMDRALLFSANKANDIWALGILSYELFYDGKHPRLEYAPTIIKTNPFFAGMLNQNRGERLNIDNTIAVFNKHYY